MAKNYLNELQGMYEFYNIIGLSNEIEYIVNSDGIYYGVLFEHKLNIDNPGSVLSQMIKYASKLRLKGSKIPEKFIANDLNRETCYVFNSVDFINDIEKHYYGPASQNNIGYSVNSSSYIRIDYSNIEGRNELSSIIIKAKNDGNYTRYKIDASNIIPLSKEYYKINCSKDDFLDGPNAEIRNPKVLFDRIKPYSKPDNMEFSHIMDCLNTNIQQAKLGAFYTPDAYVKKSQEMLLEYISSLPEGMEYIIVDRCAGTGNLYKDLPDHILERCILSTLEPNEYLILQEEFGSKSTIVIPPTNALLYDVIPTAVDGEGNVVSDYIREKISDPNCAVILYENPPYSEAGGLTMNKGLEDSSVSWKNSFVCKAMKEDIKGVASNDLANLFIWSAFKFYLTKPHDAYLVYSPIKYWKQQKIVNKNPLKAFICNRKHFHASEGAIVCVLWNNIDSNKNNFNADIYDIDNNNNLILLKQENVYKVEKLLSTAYDKRKFEDDTKDGILSTSAGLEEKNTNKKIYAIPTFNENIIAYMSIKGFEINAQNVDLVRTSFYNGHGFHLRNDNFISKLPLFCASLGYEVFKWYQKGLICKTYDGNGSYLNDINFLKKCFIYAGLSFRNKCRSLNGSDGRFYKNELCFDDNTLMSQDLSKFNLIEKELELLKLYRDILEESKKCDEYNNTFTYGSYQIEDEINIKIHNGNFDKKNKPIMINKYPTLNEKIKTLKIKLVEYYKSEIYKDLFKYELLK